MPNPSADIPDPQGCVHVYTGTGKGKTTAALGLCLRALGAGFRVYIGQFMKVGPTSEIKALNRFGDQIVLSQFGTGRFVRGRPSERDRRAALQGLQAVETALMSGDFQLVILDESLVALHQGLLDRDALHDLIDRRPKGVELVLTGRNAPPDIIDKADLVTEMQAVKHYYQAGLPARVGIEK